MSPHASIDDFVVKPVTREEFSALQVAVTKIGEEVRRHSWLVVGVTLLVRVAEKWLGLEAMEPIVTAAGVFAIGAYGVTMTWPKVRP